MANSVVDDFKFFVHRKEGEQYLRAASEGWRSTSLYGKQVAEVYAYSALEPVLKFKGISKKDYFSDEKKDLRQTSIACVVSFMRNISANKASVKENYPALFDERGILVVPEVCKEFKATLEDFYEINKNNATSPENTEFFKKAYPQIFEKNNYTNLFLSGPENRATFLRISADKNYGFDMSIYEAIEYELNNNDVFFEDFINNSDMRAHYREVFGNVRDMKKAELAEGKEISDKEVLDEMSYRTILWGDFHGRVQKIGYPTLEKIGFDQYLTMSEDKRLDLENLTRDIELKQRLEEEHRQMLIRNAQMRENDEKAGAYIAGILSDFKKNFGDDDTKKGSTRR